MEEPEELAIRTQPWIVERGDKTVITAVEAEGKAPVSGGSITAKPALNGGRPEKVL